MRYNCGGFASYTGPCGGTDCDSCYPGRNDDEDPERERAEADASRMGKLIRMIYLINDDDRSTWDSDEVCNKYEEHMRLFKRPWWADYLGDEDAMIAFGDGAAEFERRTAALDWRIPCL